MAIPASLEEYIRGVPKVELHIHIEGTLEPELMFELAARNNVTIEGSVQSHKEKRKNFKDLQDFLDLYYQACSVLLTEEDFYDLAFSYLKRASEDNVKVAEIFFDPQTHTERGVPYEVVIKGLHRAVMDGQHLLNIRASLILCFLRHLPQSKHFEVLQSALPHRDKIIGVGLDSGELGNEPHKFKEVFAEASKHGLKIVAHAGEEGGPGYIREALTCLHAQRIDHGIQCVFDDKLVEELVKKQVPLTVCPLSNIKLKVNSRFFDGQNKTKELLDKGLMVTVNSDDPAYFGGYITDNFIQTAADTGLTRQDVFKICRNAINATFLSNEDREVYLNALDDFNKQN
jgi:adenosine deaminase